jgi:hypothetical protein
MIRLIFDDLPASAVQDTIRDLAATPFDRDPDRPELAAAPTVARGASLFPTKPEPSTGPVSEALVGDAAGEPKRLTGGTRRTLIGIGAGVLVVLAAVGLWIKFGSSRDAAEIALDGQGFVNSVAAAPAGSTIFAAIDTSSDPDSPPSGRIAVIDTTTDSATTYWELEDTSPKDIVVNADGSRIFVIGSNASGGGSVSLTILDALTGKTVSEHLLPGYAASWGLALVEGGQALLARVDSDLIRIDLKTWSQRSLGPIDVFAVSPDGSVLYTAIRSDGGSTIDVRDLSTGEILKSVPADGEYFTWALAPSSDGTELYLDGALHLAMVDLDTELVTRIAETEFDGGVVNQILWAGVSKDDKRVVFTNQSRQSVSMLNRSSMDLQTVPLKGCSAGRSAISQDQLRIYVACGQGPGRAPTLRVAQLSR